ncbi:hypothetical protein TrVE_jg14091 [Triparma verrucosa]|uniref:PHD-type domain-containing protein n=1 Tax=Triparma verrucosa TaxID=1606542 RepID=A0A9W7BLD7_9STRA|nr:hypothetical protein TrVE_jg14091 [Triparma verrucosa]
MNSDTMNSVNDSINDSDIYKPRIGEDYQAIVPIFKKKVSESTRGAPRKKRGLPEFTANGEIPPSNLLWSPSHFNSVKIKDGWTVDKYILFMRSLLLQTESSDFNWRLPESTVEKSTTTSLSRKDATAIRNDRLGWVRVFPLQQDANMLEYLQSHENDVDRALYGFLSELGGGRESNARKWRRYYEGKAVATGQGWKGVINRRSDEVFKPHAMGASQEVDMEREERGGLKWYNPISRDCIDDEVEDMNVDSTPPSPEPSTTTTTTSKSKSKGNADLRFLMSNSQSMNLDLSTSRSRSSDKTEMRARWQTLHDDLTHYLEEIESAQQPPFHDVLQLLTDCTLVPPPEPIPGDDFVERVNSTMKKILMYTSRTRNWVATFHDMLRNTKQGVLIPPLRRIMEKGQELPFKLNDVDFLENVVAKGMMWEGKLEKIQENRKPSLDEIRELLVEAKSYPFPLRNAVKLSEKVAKTIAITKKISAWPLPPPPDFTLRAAQVLLRDAHRTNIDFPALAILTNEVSTGETWNEDAVKAHRNRVPLSRVSDLARIGSNLHINSDEMLEKIKAKISTSEEWIERIYVALGFSNSERPTYLEAMKKIRIMYETPGSDESRSLERFNIDGAKLPTIVDEHLLLVAELKARGWSSDAQTLLSSNPTVSALDDMIQESNELRDSLPLPEGGLQKWQIRLEPELKALANQAEAWLEKYNQYNGATPTHPKVCTLPEMRTLLAEANKINANLSSEMSVMAGFIKNAETWSATNAGLLALCGIDPEVPALPTPPDAVELTLEDLVAALAENRKVNPKIELRSISELRATVSKVEQWQKRTEIVFPKDDESFEPIITGGLRRGVGLGIADEKDSVALFKKPLASEMEELIAQTSDLPIKFESELSRMKRISTEVREWQSKSSSLLKEVDLDVEYLLDEGLDYVKEDLITEEQTSLKDIIQVIESSSKINVFTEEEALARMYKRICSFMKNVTEVFDGSDKLLNQDFDQLPSFVKEADAINSEMEKDVYVSMSEKLKEWAVKVNEQCDSLKAFQTRKQDFNKFCLDVFKFFKVEKVGKTDGEDPSSSTTGRVSPTPTNKKDSKDASKTKVEPRPVKEFSVLQQLAVEAAKYPKDLEPVRKVKREMDASRRWLDEAERVVNSDGAVLCRISMEQVNEIISSGEKLLCTMKLVKVLRSHKAAARKWASKVRKLGLEKEGVDTSKIDVEGIALEMEAFCVDMPDEALLLRQCSSVYCICRRPYDGFMLGCDGCQEWYHGPCLGITERQAENINSFLCVRCSATKTFKDAAQEGLNCCDRWLDKKVREEWRKKKHKKHYDRWKKARDEVINGKKALATAQADLQKLIHHKPAPVSKVNPSKGGVLGGTSDPQQQKYAAEQQSFMAQQQQQQQQVQQVAEQLKKTVATASATWHTAVDEDSGKTYYYNAEGETRWEKPPEPAPAPAPASAPAPVQQAQPQQQILKVAVQAVQQAPDPVKQQAINQAQKMIDQIASSVKQLNRVVKNHQNEEKKLKAEVETEERYADAFTGYFSNMKTDIFMPDSVEAAREAQPGTTGDLSPMMQKYIELANTHHVIGFADVLFAIGRFEEMCWAFMCLETLKKRPKLEELRALSAKAEGIAFSDDRAIVQVRTFLKRASDLSSSIKNIMQPSTSSKSLFNTNALKILIQQTLVVPVEIPETAKATACIEDGGHRYCVCGGASDGRFMLVCEKCEVWCHGTCMNVCEATAAKISKWVCSKCAYSKSAQYPNYDEMLRRGEDITKTAQALYKNVMGEPAEGADEGNEANMIAGDANDIETVPAAPRVKPEEPWTWAQHVSSFDELWPPFGMAPSTEDEFGNMNLKQVTEIQKAREAEKILRAKEAEKRKAAAEKKRGEMERLKMLNSLKTAETRRLKEEAQKKEREKAEAEAQAQAQALALQEQEQVSMMEVDESAETSTTTTTKTEMETEPATATAPVEGEGESNKRKLDEADIVNDGGDSNEGAAMKLAKVEVLQSEALEEQSPEDTSKIEVTIVEEQQQQPEPVVSEPEGEGGRVGGGGEGGEGGDESKTEAASS